MSLKYDPPNANSLITLIGVSFAPKSIYKTTLSSNTELFKMLAASFLLILHKIHLGSNLHSILQCFLIHTQSSIMAKHTFF